MRHLAGRILLMALTTILSIMIFVLYSKIIADFFYVRTTYKGLHTVSDDCADDTTVKILLLIPALREQNVIVNTLEHFKNIKVRNVELIICVAGTSREKSDNPEYVSTGNVVNSWIANSAQNQSHVFKYVEINEEQGDRASQLNHAVREIGGYFKPDIIGVYDADSLPDIQTLSEVVAKWSRSKETIFQQPVHFIDAANSMAVAGKNPVLVATALYQTTWTVVREYPRWRQHHLFCKKNPDKLYYRNDYLIGHGEFIPYSVYRKYYFPEQQITDGIQLGYRLSMSGADICPLNSFCSDDVPQSLSQLIGQHKRWFGGCNLLLSSYRWCKENIGIASMCQVIDGFWSQLSWAYAGIIGVVGLILSLICIANGKIFLASLELIGLFIYCYIIPYIAHIILPFPLKIRFIDWLCLPLAIFVKGIGPNLYIFQTILSVFTRKKIKYSKVER